MDTYKNVTNFDELIEAEHGKIGSGNRNKHEVNAHMFIKSERLKSARKEAKIKKAQTDV